MQNARVKFPKTVRANMIQLSNHRFCEHFDCGTEITDTGWKRWISNHLKNKDWDIVRREHALKALVNIVVDR